MQFIRRKSYLFALLAFLLALAGYFCAAYAVARSQFFAFFAVWTVVWATTGFIVYFGAKKANSIYILFAVGLIFRLLGLFAIPSLSDDYFRFIWDGRMLAAGFNPFDTRPEEWINTPLFEQLNLTELYPSLNSPRYYSVYPPLSQLWFFLGAYFGARELIYELFFLRLFIIGAEIGSFFVLKKLLFLYQRPCYLIAFYWLNPLIIIELGYNLHFEAAQIFFVLLTLYGIETRRVKIAAFAFAGAVVAKLLPLIFLPIFWFRLNLKQFLSFFLIGATLFLLAFLPFFNIEIISKIGASVGLYFKNFEFNASVYYLCREIGFWVWGNNQIAFLGRALSVLFLTISFIIAKKAKQKTKNKNVDADKNLNSNQSQNENSNLPELMLFTLTVYYLLATTIHPWYVANLLIFSVLTKYKYPVVWSFFIFLTYKSYENPYLYQENLFLVAVEYLAVVVYFCYEKGYFFSKKS